MVKCFQRKSVKKKRRIQWNFSFIDQAPIKYLLMGCKYVEGVPAFIGSATSHHREESREKTFRILTSWNFNELVNVYGNCSRRLHGSNGIE